MSLAVIEKTCVENETVDLHVDTASIVIGGGKGFLFVKRLMDIIMSAAGLVVLFIPMVIIGILIKLDSKGPAIYSQKRLGRDGKSFTIYKFRTMKVSAPKDLAAKEFENADQYITRIGSFLRRTSIDELPQLWNVLFGDMSLVGYRPLCLTETEVNANRAKQGVFVMRPGITGLAQINGRNDISDEEKVYLDTRYVRECSVKMDLICLLKTMAVVFSGKGV